MNDDALKYVLALDTASSQIAVALGLETADAVSMILSADQDADRQANVRLLPTIDAMMNETRVAKSQLSSIVCGLGPGSFTGVRIALATAKGLARGLTLPLYGVSTIDAIAWAAWARGLRGRLAVLADAMRHEVYPARFDLDESGAYRLDVFSVSKVSAVHERWYNLGTPLTLIGDGLFKYADEFTADGSGLFTLADQSHWYVSGLGLLLAHAAGTPWAAGATPASLATLATPATPATRTSATHSLYASRHPKPDAGALLPIYTRLADAEENERQRLAQGGQIAQGAQIAVSPSGVSEPYGTARTFLRPMAMQDVPAVARLEASCFMSSPIGGECWSESAFRSELYAEDRSWWVAWQGSELVGFAGGWLIDGDFHILDVAVDPDHRRQGIATLLLRRLIEDARALGANTASLEVRASNQAAIRLYQSAGFQQIGWRKGYYSADKNGSPESNTDTPPPAQPADTPPPAQPADTPPPAQPTDASPPAPREDALVMQLELTAANLRAAADYSNEARASVAGSPGLSTGLQRCELSLPASQAEPDLPPAKRHLTSPKILAIETSCDETAAAISDGSGRIVANIIASQVDYHARFGGVVPEIASRKHTEAIVGVVDAAMERAGLSDFSQLDALAVTYAPGLIGALVVGVAFAKGLSWATELPLVAVNHLEGHIYANRLQPDADNTGELRLLAEPSPPFVIALLSGGHTMLVEVQDWGRYRVLGQTLDDAVGEAFDKVAKALGLGYPGGPVISRLAAEGDAASIDFPRAMLNSGDYSFSLSGLKTAVITWIRQQQEAGAQINLSDVAASFQQAVIDVQVAKALSACRELGIQTFCLGGGVAANQALREAYTKVLQQHGIKVCFPPLEVCSDNAAMIATVARDRLSRGLLMPLDGDAQAACDLALEY